jgi:hypothetical protein
VAVEHDRFPGAGIEGRDEHPLPRPVVAGKPSGDDGPDLLALRALVNGSRKDLAAIDRHPVAAWRSGETAVVRRLAELELREAGVRLRPLPAR